jgi:hypothetical protein
MLTHESLVDFGWFDLRYERRYLYGRQHCLFVDKGIYSDNIAVRNSGTSKKLEHSQSISKLEIA